MEKIKLFFEPNSVALVGATDRAGAVGRTVLENLLVARDKRKIYPVNPNKDTILDLKCYPGLGSIPEPPGLAVIVTGAKIVPDMVEECG